MPSIGGYHPYGLASILTVLESNRACVGYAWPMNCSPSTPFHLSTGTSEALFDEWCNIPQDQIDNLILSMPRRLSARTIRCRLQQSGLPTRRPLLGLPLTQNHRCLRHQWCDEGIIWAAEWNEVVFTDESRICLQHHDGRIRVWRHRGERMLNSCVMHHHTGPAPVGAVLDITLALL
ncbi:transposable element Tcb1 transposase [Trichonephila clavipes]|nr:transposable element Tcb1 transposase [Trichonephila clavipes]